MKRKIIGVTVGTPMKPQAIIERTTQAKQIEDNKKDISNLSRELNDKQPKGNYALKDEIPTTPSQVGADAQGTAKTVFNNHNTNTEAHNDIRLELKALADFVRAVLDCDDKTLDELSEIVAYIKSNKSLIDTITTSKVNVTDIINNLTTNAPNKPLSAAQGVALMALIDGLTNTANEAKKTADTLDSTIQNALTVANSGVTLATTALSISEEARSNSNSAGATATEAKEIATEANAKADGLAESKQDNLAFDGEYNAVSNKVATVNTVASKVAEIVASAPENFDTLKEVADYIASDKTGATEINNKLSEHGTAIETNATAIEERVKKNDYANQDNAGVVKVNQTYGTRMVNGVLDLMPAQYSLIDSRSPNEYPLYLVNNGTRHQIVPANVDYAVKKSLADNKLAGTNYAWTDEEKASARELLGIDALIGDIGTVLDEMHAYAQSLVNGGNA